MDEQGQIYSAQELAERFFENQEELASQIYVEDNHIVINVAYEYNIELSRCDTNEKILGWVTHLCEKTWMTMPLMRRFIRLAQQQHNLTDPTV